MGGSLYTNAETLLLAALSFNEHYFGAFHSLPALVISFSAAAPALQTNTLVFGSSEHKIFLPLCKGSTRGGCLF